MENTTENSVIETLSERIRPFFSVGIKSRTSIFCNIKRDKELYKEILETTVYLSDNVTFAQRVYDSLHELTGITICKICKINQPAFISFTNGYRTYCCQECAGLDAEKIKKTTDKLTGRKLSEEVKQNISKAQKGKPKSESFKKKMSERMKGNTYGKANVGRKASEETRQKIGKASKGRPAWCKGMKLKPLSNEHKRKMSEALTGRVVSEETRRKNSEASKGRIMSEETRKKLSEANKGHIPWSKGKTGVYSEETLKKISENTKKAMENPEIRQKISEGLKGKLVGEDNPFYGKHHTKETKQLISKGNTGKIRTEEFKQKVSESNIKRLMNVNNNLKNRDYKRGFFYSEKNQTSLKYDSSYELAAFEILEQLSKVVSYERCPFAIKYEFEGLRKYLPDILVTYDDNSKEVIEIKPKNMLKDAKVQAKKLAGETYCRNNNMLYSTWTEKELGIHRRGSFYYE